MEKQKVFTLQQTGALFTIVIIAIWGGWVTWLHLTRPIGLDHTEIIFLSALVPVYVILVPLYVFRLRWSYISGIIVLFGLFAGLTKSIIDNTFFFSLTPYNLLTAIILLTSLACIYFSYRSYLDAKPVGWVKSLVGIGCLFAISAIGVWQISSKEMDVANYNLEKSIQGVQARTGDIKDLDSRIEALMAEGDIPSLAAAIVVDDEIVWIRDYGEGDTLNKMHDIGSITKTIIATAVLQLYEAGEIDLDDDINQYLPFVVRHPDYPNVPITIRMLLAHRSCLAHNNETYWTYTMGPELQKWGVDNRGWGDHNEFKTLPYEEFMVGYLEPGGKYFVPENWADCRPGSNFVYSTPGYDLLGYLVALVSGQPLSEYLHEYIFSPLEMSSSTATLIMNPEDIATPYERWYGILSKTNVELPRSQRRIIGGGGIYATVGDLANFLIAHMNQGNYDGLNILKPDTIKLMHQKTSDTHGDFLQVGYGYGWSLYQNEPRQMWDITFQPRGYQGHGGRYWGYSSAMYMVEVGDASYGYVVLLNHSMVESMDHPMLFSTHLNIQDLILNEAYRLYQETENQ